MKSITKSFFLLIVIALVTTFASYLFSNNNWTSQFFSNIATGIFGSLVIILLIDRILEKNKEETRQQLIRVGLRRLRPHLWSHLTLFLELYRAITSIKPPSLPNDFKDLFTDDFYQNLSQLNYQATVIPQFLPPQTWSHYLIHEIASFRDHLRHIVDMYAEYFDSYIIDIIDTITRSPLIISMQALKDDYSRIKDLSTYVSNDDYLSHINFLLILVDYYNSKQVPPLKLKELLAGTFETDLHDSIKWGSGRKLPS